MQQCDISSDYSLSKPDWKDSYSAQYIINKNNNRMLTKVFK